MRPLEQHLGLVVPMEGENVNTDAILPKQFMKSIERTGFGVHLFDGLRYLDVGEPGVDCSTRPLNSEFVLNQPRYQGASVLLARKNFGCGSSREHAPWALDQYGIRVLIAPSFADIFANNCFKNGLLPIELGEAVVQELFDEVASTEGYVIQVDLKTQVLSTPSGRKIEFSVEPGLRERLLFGLDEIGMTLELREKISNYEAARRASHPWMFESSPGKML